MNADRLSTGNSKILLGGPGSDSFEVFAGDTDQAILQDEVENTAGTSEDNV
jgi:hypothetical protein